MRCMLTVAFILLAAAHTARGSDDPESFVTRLTGGIAPPLVATQPNSHPQFRSPVFALIFPKAGAAQLVVLSRGEGEAGSVVASSRQFGYEPTANYGAAIEGLEAQSPGSFSLHVTVREGCARGVRTHKFAIRGGIWTVVGRDASGPKCTDAGVETAWSTSANFLTAKAERTRYVNNMPAGRRTVSATRPAFSLSEFPPKEYDPDYDELQ